MGPNSSLGKALNYLLKRWDEVTLFLRRAAAPLDNNICERTLKRETLHCKNSMFYKTAKGSEVGATSTCPSTTPAGYATSTRSSICRRCSTTPRPCSPRAALWLPWNYHEQLGPRPLTSADLHAAYNARHAGAA